MGERRKKAVPFFPLFTVAMGFFGGCATIFKDNTDPVRFNSDPAEVKVYISSPVIMRAG